MNMFPSRRGCIRELNHSLTFFLLNLCLLKERKRNHCHGLLLKEFLMVVVFEGVICNIY